jgi:hypothetical protein
MAPGARSDILSHANDRFTHASSSAVSSSASSVPDEQRLMSASSTKKPRPRRGRARPPESLAREHDLDYSRSRPNRFAGELSEDAVVVVLDEDVAAVFQDPKRVNALLRATIAAMEPSRKKSAG